MCFSASSHLQSLMLFSLFVHLQDLTVHAFCRDVLFPHMVRPPLWTRQSHLVHFLLLRLPDPADSKYQTQIRVLNFVCFECLCLFFFYTTYMVRITDPDPNRYAHKPPLKYLSICRHPIVLGGHVVISLQWLWNILCLCARLTSRQSLVRPQAFLSEQDEQPASCSVKQT